MSVKKKPLRIQVELTRKQKVLKLGRELRRAKHPGEVRRLGEKLGEMIFGNDSACNAPASEGGRYMKRRGRPKAAPTVFT
jgi:hypothetical protein